VRFCATGGGLIEQEQMQFLAWDWLDWRPAEGGKCSSWPFVVCIAGEQQSRDLGL